MNSYHLSTQAIASFVLVVQKGILEQRDVTQMMRDLIFVVDENNELFVQNPPTGIDVDEIQRKNKIKNKRGNKSGQNNGQEGGKNEQEEKNSENFNQSEN